MATEKRLIDANELHQGLAFAEFDTIHDRLVITKIIHNAPTVDAVEVVHGRWKAHKPDCRGYTAGFICSSCGNIVYTDYCTKECDYDYCPNCGAKMDGDGNG